MNESNLSLFINSIFSFNFEHRRRGTKIAAKIATFLHKQPSQSLHSKNSPPCQTSEESTASGT